MESALEKLRLVFTLRFRRGHLLTNELDAYLCASGIASRSWTHKTHTPRILRAAPGPK